MLAETLAGCYVDTRKLVQGPLQRLNVGPLQTNRDGGNALPGMFSDFVYFFIASNYILYDFNLAGQ